MRISTNMIYDKGIGGIQQQMADVVQTGQQLSTGKKVLTPADNPIAATRALELTSARGVNTQFTNIQGYANDNLKLLESKLTGIGDILQYSRERAVQAGNGALNSGDLGRIAADMRSQFDALLALGNSQDANGEYLFAGYKAQTQPFVGNLAGVSYQGDQGSRTMQVSQNRYMPVSVPGSELFDNAGTLATSLSGFTASANGGTGSVAISYNPAQPAAANVGRRYDITYTGADYSITEFQPGNPTPVTVATGLAGPTLSFNGLQVNVGGAPAAGDRFEVFVASKNVFENFALFVDTLEKPGAGGAASGVAFALGTFDNALDNVLKIRAQTGSQMVEVEQLQTIGSDVDLQYATTLSDLEDVDYAEAISRLTQQQAFLQAAQQSFMRISSLSLFNFLQ